MTINPNISLVNGYNAFQQSWQLMNRSNERLATGLQINRGSDDPAGLIASEVLGSRLTEIRSSIRSYERTNSTLAIEDGTLGAVSGSIGDLDELVVRGANSGALDDDELDSVVDGAAQIVSSVESQLGAAGIGVLEDVRVEREVGTDPVTGDPVYETVGFGDLSKMIGEDPETARALVDAARDAVVERRAEIGAQQRANESEIRAMRAEQINVARARSVIRDTDFGLQAAESVRGSILNQASIGVMLIGRAQRWRVLDLLA